MVAGARKIIICVDDNEEVLKSLRLQLRNRLRRNARIVLASRPEDALKALTSLEPAPADALLVITDWLMPDMTGEALIREISERWNPLSAIVLSGHITESAAQDLEAMEQVLAIMPKPWDGDMLIETISQHFGLPSEQGDT